MGWRADQAYEAERQEAFREWKASLTWREYWSWQWDRHRHVLGGMAAGGAITLMIWFLAK